MFDISAIRNTPEDFDKGWARRGLSAQTPYILALDKEKRAIQTKLQELQARRNEESKKIGEIKKTGGDAAAQMAAVAAMKDEMTALEEQERTVTENLKDLLSSLPNILGPEVPDGADESENKELHKWGTIKSLKGPDHVEIGEALGMMDFEAAAKISGARFTILSAGLARMERALGQFFLDTHTGADHGFTEVSPPLLVRDNALYGTGQLPKFKEDLFESVGVYHKLVTKIDIALERRKNLNKKIDLLNEVINEIMKLDYLNQDILTYFNSIKTLQIEELNFCLNETKSVNNEANEVLRSGAGRSWLIPTAEVPLTNIVADMIVEEEYLPRRYAAYTPCFRSEAGSAGRDTRGMLRQHQFYKVEMVSVTAPEKSEDEHEHMLSCAENVLKKLEIPFRTIMLCSGDTGFGARKTYDIEAWLPGQETYREISSVSNCWDFQARRMNARTRAKGEKETRFVHTLNGSGVAVGRALIAVIENYYDPSDGGIFVPEVLQPYMGGLKKIVK